jgi:hypothetical protein
MRTLVPVSTVREGSVTASPTQLLRAYVLRHHQRRRVDPPNPPTPMAASPGCGWHHRELNPMTWRTSVTETSNPTNRPIAMSARWGTLWVGCTASNHFGSSLFEDMANTVRLTPAMSESSTPSEAIAAPMRTAGASASRDREPLRRAWLYVHNRFFAFERGYAPMRAQLQPPVARRIRVR